MYLHSPDHQFTLQNFASHMINIIIANITIEETEMKFNGSNISLHVENSLIRSSAVEFYGFSKSNQPIVICNCTFDESPATKNYTSSVLMSDSLLSFNSTNVELYSCNFTRTKDYCQTMLCLEGNVTMMDMVANGIEGTFMITHKM